MIQISAMLSFVLTEVGIYIYIYIYHILWTLHPDIIKTKKIYFSFLLYFNNLSLHVSNRVTIHHQEAVTVYAAYGIYHAENILKLCKILPNFNIFSAW